MNEQVPEPEFSVTVDLAGLPRGGKRFKLSANAEECARIAERLGVPAVARLEGEINLKANAKTIEAEGKISAALTRICVASLEEMAEAVDERFSVNYVREETASLPDPEDESWDAPEYHEGDRFDLGELLTQQLALAMTAFPRKEGAASLADQYGAVQNDSPFAALQGKFEKSE